MKVYLATVDLKSLPGSQLAREEYLGAFATLYIPAYSDMEAEEKMTEALSIQRYELIKCEHLGLLDDVVFEHASDEERALEMADHALGFEQVIFDGFKPYLED